MGDYDAFAAFSNTYNDALQLLSKSDATDAELAAMADKLRDAKAVVDAAINPVTDGVYYIESAATMFAGKDTMVWYGPRYDNYPGWAKRVTKVTYMWKIQKLADGNYSIQNFGNGQYVSHTDVVDGTNSHMHLTDALQTEQQIDFVSPDGQFNIHSAGAKWVYNAQDHKNGSASVGWIASYSSKAKGSEGAWRIVRVSDADLAQAEADRNRDVLHQTIAATGTKYVLGTDPGQYSETAYNSFIEVRTSSLDMVKDTTGKYTETDFAAALSKFKAAHEALLASINPITDGYYSISTVPYADLKKGKSGLAFTQNGDAAWLYGFQWDVDNPAFLWQIKKVQGGYSVQNYISKLYINSTDLISAGASINLSKTQTTAQVFTHTLNDEFQVSNTVLKPSNFGYVAIGDLVYIAGGGISFYLHKFSDEEVAKIAEAYPQQLRTDTLKNLIAEMSAKTGVDSVYTMNMESPLLTDASQIYINNLSTEQPNLGNLLDNDFNTFCISAWNESSVTSENAPHSIRIDAGEGKTLPLKFGLHWRTRGSTWANMYRPVDVTFSVSDDAATWVQLGELKNPEAGFPATAEEPEYTSKDPIVTSKPYRYFKMTVLKTNTGQTGKYGYPFFTFSEFNAYPMIAAANPALNDPELVEALQNMRAAIAKAEPIAAAGNATSQDIADLQKAYTEFLLVWKDTADLQKVYEEATAFSPSVVAGSEMFCYPDDKVEAFENAWTEVDEARPFSNIKQREVARLDTLLTRALDELRQSMIGPDPDTWYTVKSADATAKDGSGNSILNQIAWMGGNTSVDGLGCGGADDTAMLTDPRRAWKFEYTGTPCVYNMICAGNGWPINRGPVRLSPLGDGQFAIYTGADLNSAYWIQTAVLPGVPNNNLAVAKDGRGAWSMEPAPQELTYTMRLQQGRVMAVTLPFETYELPSSDDAPVEVYRVCGYTLADDGKTVTGIRLGEMESDTIAAATPFVVVVDGDNAYNADSIITIDFKAKVNGAISRETTPQNGLYGTFSRIALAQGMIYFNRDSAYVEPENFTVIPQRAYVNVNAITDEPETEASRIIPVAGNVQVIPVGISGTKSVTPARVDVYTLDGVAVRRSVKAATATKGLSRGVYIVGKRKVLVK